MHFPSLFFAATACMRVAYADFVIITEEPWPMTLRPTFAVQSEANQWTTSVVFNAQNSFADVTEAYGSSYESTKSSVHSVLSNWVASSASNFSIPTQVTESGTATIPGIPDWYSALPSEVVSFKEAEWTNFKSVVSDVIVARLTTSSTNGAPALPTGHAGLKNAGWAVAGAAAAAAFL